MYQFTVYPEGYRDGDDMIEVRDNYDRPHHVKDDHVGCAARELLNTNEHDGLGIHPAWMAHEVTHRAALMEQGVDPNYDFEIREYDARHGLTSTIIVRNARGRDRK